jgi:hypothetical protein
MIGAAFVELATTPTAQPNRHRSGTGSLLIASHAAAPAGWRIGWMSGIRI